MAERITFTTSDDVVIVGDWYPTPTVLGAVLLLHAMPETRSSWALFQRELAKRNIASLAIDLRGHGESTKDANGIVLNYSDFEDADHQASEYDVTGAVEWLHSRGMEDQRIAFGGASFGADLALLGLVDYPRAAGAFLLSPGVYRGIDPIEVSGNILLHQSLYIVVSEDDKESLPVCQRLYAGAPVENKTLVPYKSGGHGTELFATDKALPSKVADWMAKLIRG